MVGAAAAHRASPGDRPRRAPAWRTSAERRAQLMRRRLSAPNAARPAPPSANAPPATWTETRAAQAVPRLPANVAPRCPVLPRRITAPARATWRSTTKRRRRKASPNTAPRNCCRVTQRQTQRRAATPPTAPAPTRAAPTVRMTGRAAARPSATRREVSVSTTRFTHQHAAT